MYIVIAYHNIHVHVLGMYIVIAYCITTCLSHPVIAYHTPVIAYHHIAV